MKVLVVGCGRLGAELAGRLFHHGHDVSVIDVDDKAFLKLPPDFEGRMNEGEAIDRDVLHRAGIELANAVAAVTDSDVLNAVVGHIAREYYNISNVVVRNHDPRYRAIHEAFGLQVVGAFSWGAQRIEEMIYHSEMRAVFSAGNGEVEVYEVPVPEAWSGQTVASLADCAGCIPVSITRAGRADLPSADITLQSGDVLHVSATLEGIETLRRKLLSSR